MSIRSSSPRVPPFRSASTCFGKKEPGAAHTAVKARAGQLPVDGFERARGQAHDALKGLEPRAREELREAVEHALQRQRLEELAGAVKQQNMRQRIEELAGAVKQQNMRQRLEELADAVKQQKMRQGLEELAGAVKQQSMRQRLEEVADAVRQQVMLQRLGGAAADVAARAMRPSPGDNAPVPATTTWQVQPGDTVGDISWALMQQGVPGPVEEIARQIVELNGLTNPDLIYAGSTLVVPAVPGSTQAPGTPGLPGSAPGGAESPGAPSTPGTAAPGTPGGPGATPSTPGERYPVPYINQINSEGTEDDWNRFSNCGPTTLAMIAKGFGLGGGLSDGAFINQLANSIGMGAEGTGYVGMEQMAANLGLQTETRAGSDVGWIRQQLEAGNLVAVNGESSVMLANEQPPYASGNFSGGHWIAVTGMTPEGNFIVKDPSSTCRELTPDQLERFLASHHAGGFATAIQPPPGVAPTEAPASDLSAQGARLESLRLAPGAWSLAETGFAGQGEQLLRLSEKYDVPIDLALAMLWKESQWGSTGLSREHNNPGNLKFVGQEGAYDAFTSPGAAGSFAGWPTMEQGIEAYFKLLGTYYRSEIDSGNWEALVYRYAPPSENDSAQYLQQVYTYAAEVRRHLGIE
ncbi:glucosaminidase domain-containing protein [Myxococcus sp. Y35]|uniref:glucosaminidase domain-containing protein n=1 Tax=Pseudomyxococcus flavus TaxID=3115648 RepID=UPI003CF18813